MRVSTAGRIFTIVRKMEELQMYLEENEPGDYGWLINDIEIMKTDLNDATRTSPSPNEETSRYDG